MRHVVRKHLELRVWVVVHLRCPCVLKNAGAAYRLGYYPSRREECGGGEVQSTRIIVVAVEWQGRAWPLLHWTLLESKEVIVR